MKHMHGNITDMLDHCTDPVVRLLILKSPMVQWSQYCPKTVVRFGYEDLIRA